MDPYVTGTVIRRLREAKGMTQAELAQALKLSDKAVSKWETGKGYPDITLLEALASALEVSVAELLSGVDIVNKNRSANLLRGKLYVCPVCGNILFGVGEALITCCGVTLPPLEAEAAGEELQVEAVEDEYLLTVDHEMDKQHFVSFLAALSDDGFTLKKLYPEGAAQARLPRRKTSAVYYYCNRHGLFCKKLPPRKQGLSARCEG